MMNLRLLALVLVALVFTAMDASAFGKRSRGSSCSSCSSGQCQSAQGCATSCSNGQCSPQASFGPTFVGSDGTKYKQVCENGKCFLVVDNSATPSGSPVVKPSATATVTLHKDGDAWKDASGNAWKQSK